MPHHDTRQCVLGVLLTALAVPLCHSSLSLSTALTFQAATAQGGVLVCSKVSNASESLSRFSPLKWYSVQPYKTLSVWPSHTSVSRCTHEALVCPTLSSVLPQLQYPTPLGRVCLRTQALILASIGASLVFALGALTSFKYWHSRALPPEPPTELWAHEHIRVHSKSAVSSRSCCLTVLGAGCSLLPVVRVCALSGRDPLHRVCALQLTLALRCFPRAVLKPQRLDRVPRSESSSQIGECDTLGDRRARSRIVLVRYIDTLDQCFHETCAVKCAFRVGGSTWARSLAHNEFMFTSLLTSVGLPLATWARLVTRAHAIHTCRLLFILCAGHSWRRERTNTYSILLGTLE